MLLVCTRVLLVCTCVLLVCTRVVFKSRFIISLTLCLCRVGPHAKVLRIFEEWHVAFHGTQAKYLQPIFNNGAQLLMAGRFTNKLFSFVV